MQWHKLVKVMIVGVGLLGSAMVLPAIAQLRESMPGSFLIFPEFNIAPPAVTQIRISDVQNPAFGGTTRIHLNYICPGTSQTSASVCPEVDSREFTTFHGTIIIDVASELGGAAGAPCLKGFIIAFVEDAEHHAISANQLIGSYRISGTDGDDAEAVQAIAVQSKQDPNTQLGSFDANGELVLSFGLAPSADYVALPSILYTDFQAVNLGAIPPKRTELIVLTPSIKSGLSNQVTQLAIHWWNQFEDEHSTTKSFTCWTEFELESLPGGGLFTAAGLGTPYGSLQARVTGGAPPQAILGVIRETGPGPTLRRLYHVGLRSSTYGPDPDTAPPGP
jgi:hypothetical protein